jgi:hypothetical protein
MIREAKALGSAYDLYRSPKPHETVIAIIIIAVIAYPFLSRRLGRGSTASR